MDGQFPLTRFLGAGGRGAVFLTRIDSRDAAIKLVPSADADADQLLDDWSRAARLDHPHLIKILATGTSTNAGTPLAYVVTEYAEDNLAQVLTERRLTADEVLEMLPAIADTLAFLHDRGYALSNLKPSNIFSVDDTLKLASDAVSAGDPSTDLRALAGTVTQALTGKPVTFEAGADRSEVDSLPEPFRQLVRYCLGQDGRSPLSAGDVVNWLRSPESPDIATTKAVPFGTHRSRLASFGIGLALFLIAVITAGSLLRNRETAAAPPVSHQPPAVAVSPDAEPKAPPPAEPQSADEVVRRVLPEIPAKARRTIRGTATVVVKVRVNEAGDVTDATPRPGGSVYFRRLATAAARNWRFAPSPGGDSREYFVRFEMTRTDTKTMLQKSAEVARRKKR